MLSCRHCKGQLKQQQEHAIAHMSRPGTSCSSSSMIKRCNSMKKRSTAQLTQALGNSNLALTEGSLRQLRRLAASTGSITSNSTCASTFAVSKMTPSDCCRAPKPRFQEFRDQNETKSQLQLACGLLESQHDALAMNAMPCVRNRSAKRADRR